MSKRVPVKTLAGLREGFVAWAQFWKLVHVARVKGVTLYTIERLDRHSVTKPRAEVLKAAWRPKR